MALKTTLKKVRNKLLRRGVYSRTPAPEMYAVNNILTRTTTKGPVQGGLRAAAAKEAAARNKEKVNALAAVAAATATAAAKRRNQLRLLESPKYRVSTKMQVVRLLTGERDLIWARFKWAKAVVKTMLQNVKNVCSLIDKESCSVVENSILKSILEFRTVVQDQANAWRNSSVWKGTSDTSLLPMGPVMPFENTLVNTVETLYERATINKQKKVSAFSRDAIIFLDGIASVFANFLNVVDKVKAYEGPKQNFMRFYSKISLKNTAAFEKQATKRKVNTSKSRQSKGNGNLIAQEPSDIEMYRAVRASLSSSAQFVGFSKGMMKLFDKVSSKNEDNRTTHMLDTLKLILDQVENSKTNNLYLENLVRAFAAVDVASQLLHKRHEIVNDRSKKMFNIIDTAREYLLSKLLNVSADLRSRLLKMLNSGKLSQGAHYMIAGLLDDSWVEKEENKYAANFIFGINNPKPLNKGKRVRFSHANIHIIPQIGRGKQIRRSKKNKDTLPTRLVNPKENVR